MSQVKQIIPVPSDDWLTPHYMLDVLGKFDLDPCASNGIGQRKTADHMVRLPQNGLADDFVWSGRIFCNPPYSDAGPWVKRLADSGNGIAIVFAKSSAAWFQQEVLQRADAVLWLHGRLRFLKPDGTPGDYTARESSVLVAYGAQNALALAGCGLDGYLTMRGVATGLLQPPTLTKQKAKKKQQTKAQRSKKKQASTGNRSQNRRHNSAVARGAA